MGDVRGEDRADLVGDLAERLEVERSRIGGGAGPEDLRPVLLRELSHLVHVDAVILAAHAVRHALEVLARDRDGVAVREVAAGREAEAHHDVARLAEGEVHGEVRRAARVGLHVDVDVVDRAVRRLAEEGAEACDRELLDLIDDLLALVVALPRVALGVLVREAGAGRLHHRARGVILAGDEAHRLVLAPVLVFDELEDLGVDLGKILLGHAHRTTT